ncbi:MAG TPA: hypothetical protein VKR54_04230 [Candidatus Babeliales bacterium]|jgi:hypothetical protein|nr:hypothetical protein [Candidatus Babeliales bacterium]
MKSRFFPKRDEVVLSTITALLIVGLCYQGLTALMNGKEHEVFQKSPVVVVKK